MSTNLTSSVDTKAAVAISRVVIREATAADRRALARLAQRDSTSVPTGRLLVAEHESELRAAVAVESGRAIADPFHGTADLVALLRARARQLAHSQRRPLKLVARTAWSPERPRLRHS